jgi:predicted amidohydrolase YtcJ
MNENSPKKALTRRRFVATSAAATAALGAALEAGPAAVVLSAQNPAASVGDDITLALVNGRIHTLDDRNTVANTVTIRNGRFLKVGGPKPKAGPGVRVIDLRGRTAVAGLVEPHIHIVSLGNRPGYHTILENTTSIREVQEALAARRKEAPEGAWITSMGGWHPNQWA